MLSRVYRATLLLIAGLGGAATATDGDTESQPPNPACYERLGKIARFSPVPSAPTPSECAVADLVRLESILMTDRSQVRLARPPTLHCAMAEAVSNWVRDEVGPSATQFGAPLTGISNLDSYQCRTRNRVAGGKLSEHAKGNAIDISAITIATGRTYNLVDPKVSSVFRERFRAAACQAFTTVLGPGSDAYHSDHIHLDLAERSRGYRICQWEVLDEVPLPRAKPAELAIGEPILRKP